MREKKEAVAFCLTFPEVYEDYPFRDTSWCVIRHKKTKKIFAWIFDRNGAVWINVKCDPEWRDFWREAYASVIPAYHLNKTYWNSIILDGSVPEKEIRRMIGESYDLTKEKKKAGGSFAKLRHHYQNIFKQHKEALLRGGTGDPYLLADASDTRMALALLIRLTPEVTEPILAWMEELRQTEPDLYYYPKEDLHLTVLDILRGEPGREIPPDIGDYIRCIGECATDIESFSIDFTGVTASDNAVLVCGYYENGLNELRQSLRSGLSAAGLKTEERYETFSAHATVARIPKRLSDPAEFLKRVPDNRVFGRMRVDSVSLVFHNWYDSVKITMAEFPLKTDARQASLTAD